MVRGGCLCGSVSFEIDGELTSIQYCHAVRCRKATGSAFAAELAARADTFRWVRGAELVTVYEAPLLREPPPYRHAFCRRCGSPLPVPLEGTEFLALHAGVLDGEPGTQAFRHIFVAQNPSWHTIADEMPRFEQHAQPASVCRGWRLKTRSRRSANRHGDRPGRRLIDPSSLKPSPRRAWSCDVRKPVTRPRCTSTLATPK